MSDRIIDSAPYERLYVSARFAALTVAVAIAAWGVTSYPGLVHTNLAVAGNLLFALTTIAALAARRLAGVEFVQTMLWAAPFDLAAIALLGSAFHGLEDPLYPALLAMPIFYALVMRRREAWIVGAAAAVVYLLIHGWYSEPYPGLHLMIVGVKAALIVYISVVASVTASRFLERANQIRRGTEEKERLNVQMQRRLAELQAITQITEIIHSSLDFDQVGPLLLEVLTKVIGVPSCALFVIDKRKSETLFSASYGLAAEGVPEAPRDPSVIETVAMGESHFACLSVLDHHQMMVVFCAEAAFIDRLSDEDRLVLQSVSSELVVAVENSQLYKLTKRLAITDELTGLFNYRYLQQRLDEEIERARRYGKDVSLLMVDADDFKLYNDAKGHIAGDEALADMAGVMRKAVREVDIVCRYGGEEFSIVLPETDSAGAFVVAEKLREAIENHEFGEVGQGPVAHISISVGLAAFPSHAHDKESLLRQADDALFDAKHGGKNRVRAPRSAPSHASEPDPAEGT